MVGLAMHAEVPLPIQLRLLQYAEFHKRRQIAVDCIKAHTRELRLENSQQIARRQILRRFRKHIQDELPLIRLFITIVF